MREQPPITGAEPEYPTVVVKGEFFDWRFRVKDGELQCKDAHRLSEEGWVFLESGSLAIPTFINGAEREKLEAFIREQTQPIAGSEPEYATIAIRGEEFDDWQFRVRDGVLEVRRAAWDAMMGWASVLEPDSEELPSWVLGEERVKLKRFLAEQTGVAQWRTVPDSLERLVGEISHWQAAQFPHATPHSTATHLLKEARELLEEIDRGEHSNHLNIREEIADIFHMLIAVANACYVGLLPATRAKFEKNKLRVWGKPDKDGVVEHVAEGCEDATPARADVVDQDVPRPRLYIAGPMTGMPDFNYPAFRAEAKRWRDAGWDVVDPSESHDGRTDLPYEAYVEYDMEQLPTCDAIVMLPGWNGKGARGSVWEYHVAKSLGLTVFSAEGEVVPAEQHGRTRTAMPAMLELSPTPPPPERVQEPMLPEDPHERKQAPITSGVIDYFPLALAEIAKVSKAGNDQHNPGQPLHWARGKSMDHPDCIVRHLVDRGLVDTDGQRHTAKGAWRYLALLEEEMEQVLGKGLPRGASQEK